MFLVDIKIQEAGGRGMVEKGGEEFLIAINVRFVLLVAITVQYTHFTKLLLVK